MTVPQTTGDLPTLVPPSEKSVQATTETLWKIYGAINEWIRFADAKAAAVLTANGVLVGATITALQGNSGFLFEHQLTCAFAVLGLLCAVASTLFCLQGYAAQSSDLPSSRLSVRNHPPLNLVVETGK